MLGFEPYVALSKKEWVGLTDEERIDCRRFSPIETAKLVEAKLKEKNEAT